MRRSPETRSKCRFRLNTGRECWRQRAAIQTSLERNRGSGSFEFTANGGIGGRGLLIHVQDPELRKVFDKPVFVASPLARLLDAISVFAQDNDRNSDWGRLSKDRFE